jgi:hypothetical protein
MRPQDSPAAGLRRLPGTEPVSASCGTVRPSATAFNPASMFRPTYSTYMISPQVAWSGNCLFFYSGDRQEPHHVHVERDGSIAKFWLTPVRLQKAGGFGRTELARIHRLIEEHRARLIEAWNEYFGQ